MSRLEEDRKSLTELLKKGKRFALAYHSDADGMGAAKILIEHLYKNRVDRSNIKVYPVNTNDRLLREDQENDVLKDNFDILIYMDLCNHRSDQLKRLRKKVKHIVSIDHHYFKEGWPECFDLYINSKFFDELTRPQVHTASKLLNTIFYNAKNDWLEIIGLEGDVAVPSLPGTLSYEVTQILNLLGLIQNNEEPLTKRDERSNTLLNCLLDSDNLSIFLDSFRKIEDLSRLYDNITRDIATNVENLLSLQPRHKTHSNLIYVYDVEAKAGYDIIGQLLKAHFPYLAYNCTYILHQKFPGTKEDQVFLYTSNPLIDCFKIAVDNGGGGHTNRAGFPLKQNSFDETVKNIIETINNMILTGEKEYASNT